MHTKGPLDAPVTSGSVVGGVARGLRNGFDVAPRGARASHARPRARPFPVTARFGHPLLENRFPQHLFGMLSLGKLGPRANFRLNIPFWYVFWTSQKSGSSYELGLRLRTIAAARRARRGAPTVTRPRGDDVGAGVRCMRIRNVPALDVRATHELKRAITRCSGTTSVNIALMTHWLLIQLQALLHAVMSFTEATGQISVGPQIR